MKLISSKRHAQALKKEIKFWKNDNILESQEFQTKRYIPYLLQAHKAQKCITNVLDVGCGPACCAQHIPAGDKWYLDPLIDDYLRLFKEKIPAGKYIAKNAEEADFKPDSFELIICLNAFDHLRDPWLTLRKIHLWLSAHGILPFSLYTRNPLLAFLRNLQEYFYLSTDIAHPYTFTRERMESELEKAGFAIGSEEVMGWDAGRKEYLWVCTKK